MPEKPVRDLTPEEITAFQDDGVVCARGVIQSHWIDRLVDAVERTVAQMPAIRAHAELQADGFSGDLYMWLHDDDYRAIVFDSPHALLARQAMGSDGVTFFHDQLFVKEPGSTVETPWHHDLTFWPVEGDQICSIWMPLERVTEENSGLEYVRGSHRWSNRFKPIGVGYLQFPEVSSHLEEIPDIDGHRSDYDLLHWDMDPGDVLLFHPLTLHGASGNHSTTRRRRALATRWFGDDVVYREVPAPLFLPPGSDLRNGAPFTGPNFPRVLGDEPQPAATAPGGSK